MKKLITLLVLLVLSASLNVHLLMKEPVVVEKIIVQKEEVWPEMKTARERRLEKNKERQERDMARNLEAIVSRMR